MRLGTARSRALPRTSTTFAFQRASDWTNFRRPREQGVRQAIRNEFVVDELATLLARDQAGLFQDPQVSGEGGFAEIESLGDFASAELALVEIRKDLAAGGGGNGFEYLFHGDYVFRKLIKYFHTEEAKSSVRLGRDHLYRLEQTLPMILKRRGVERRLVIAPGKIKTLEPDPQILKAIRTGYKFWEQLKSDHPATAVDFAKREGVDNRYVGGTLALAFLAPSIVERFMSGQHLPDWTAERLLRWNPLPTSWPGQQEIFDRMSLLV